MLVTSTTFAAMMALLPECDSPTETNCAWQGTDDAFFDLFGTDMREAAPSDRADAYIMIFVRIEDGQVTGWAEGSGSAFQERCNSAALSSDHTAFCIFRDLD